MDITKCLTLSTGHVSEDTIKKLEEEPDTNEMNLSVYPKGEYGFWIYCSDTLIDYPEHIPNDLWACMLLANKNDCKWLCLDCDGEESDELEWYR